MVQWQHLITKMAFLLFASHWTASLNNSWLFTTYQASVTLTSNNKRYLCGEWSSIQWKRSAHFGPFKGNFYDIAHGITRLLCHWAWQKNALCMASNHHHVHTQTNFCIESCMPSNRTCRCVFFSDHQCDLFGNTLARITSCLHSWEVEHRNANAIRFLSSFYARMNFKCDSSFDALMVWHTHNICIRMQCERFLCALHALNPFKAFERE